MSAAPAAPLTPGQSQFVGRLASNTGLNPGVVASWVLAEENGTAAQQREAQGNHNWLNIGYFDSGPGAIAHSHVFSNPVSAADATSNFLKGTWGGASPGIRSILSTAGKDPLSQISAIAGSGWASSGYNGGSTLRSLFSQYGAGVKGVAQQRASKGAAPAAPSAAPVPRVSTTFSGGGTDWGTATADALLSSAPTGFGGNFKASDLLNKIISNAESGNYTTPPQANTKLSAPAASTALTPALPSSAKGDINPVAHATIGRTDMGVDATLKPGDPIRALNTSRVVGILPNWYQGQPLVWMQLTDGPNKGKYWYVSEQITNLPKVGQVIQRGAPVAQFAPTGTGIELGWATADGRTLAQATTGYHEGEVTPAGQSFRTLLTSSAH